MNKDAKRSVVGTLCGLVCIACPVVIFWFGHTYGFDRLPSDADFRAWRVDVVEWLFGLSLVTTVGVLVAVSAQWRLLIAFIVVPLWVVTGFLSVTCSMWLDGTYW